MTTEDRKHLLQRIRNTEAAITETDDRRTRASLDAHLTELRDEFERTAPPVKPVPTKADERFAFIECNGRTMVSVPSRPGVRLFATGAMFTGYGDDYTEKGFDPPTDDLSRLTLRRQFHRLRLEPFESDFRLLQVALSVGGSAPFHWLTPETKRYGPPSGDGPTDLKRIAAVARVERDAIDAIDAEIAELPATKAKRAKAEAAARIEAEAASFRAEKEAEARAVTI